jgi:hypothetical protein
MQPLPNVRYLLDYQFKLSPETEGVVHHPRMQGEGPRSGILRPSQE